MPPIRRSPKTEAEPSLDAWNLQEALSELAPLVVAFMQHHVGDVHLGADLAQDALAQAMRRLGSLRDARALRGWVFRIAINCFTDHLRRSKLLEKSTEPVKEPSAPAHAAPDRELLARELDSVLRRELLSLPERQRSVLLLHGIRDLCHSEIAGLLGISVDAVKMSLFHAREKMRRRLALYLGQAPGAPLGSLSDGGGS